MTNLEFAQKLIAIANSDTTYALGGYGQKATTANKVLFKAMYSKNRTSETISTGIANATANTSMYDCNGLIKSTINGNKGYTTSPCPDKNIEWMFNNCSELSSDMSEIEVGEYLVYSDLSHCGVYVGTIDGRRMAAECTYRWNNGVQLIDIDREERKGMWAHHGKLSKFITYPTAKDIHKAELKVYADRFLATSRGAQSRYVQAIQTCLVDNGYTYVDACGYFGDDTERAVKDFQSKSGISVSGVVDFDTINALVK